MDKETQIKELTEAIDKHQVGCDLPKECNTECELCAAEAIYELGYRRLLDKSPLLSKHIETIIEEYASNPQDYSLAETAKRVIELVLKR